jgi:hypothetical protein
VFNARRAGETRVVHSRRVNSNASGRIPASKASGAAIEIPSSH